MKPFRLCKSTFGTWSAIVVLALLTLLDGASAAEVDVQGTKVTLGAGSLRRIIDLSNGNVTTTSLTVDGNELLLKPSKEFSVTFYQAQPNECPKGIKAEDVKTISSTATFGKGTDTLAVEGIDGKSIQQNVQWKPVAEITASTWSDIFNHLTHQVEKPQQGVTRLTITATATEHPVLKGVSISLIYEVYEGHAAIRKRVQIANRGDRWLKIDKMAIENLELGGVISDRVPLTPSERGAKSSVIAFDAKEHTFGILGVSEVPSALRAIWDSGSLGYSYQWFEWAVGPGEKFESEPVFYYAYSGSVVKTISATSTPLDRTLEGPYMQFLKDCVGVAADHSPIYAPQWATWSNFRSDVNDKIVREMADIAARCGFVQLELDDGWQWDRLGIKPHEKKFPDLDATAQYVQSKGLKLGLWVACYRSPGSKTLADMPDMRAVPLRTRLTGYGMSFASPWRKYYAEELLQLHRRYGAVYFKQDFTNIKLGDIAEGHDSRTYRESLLRGLRGLLESQDIIRKEAPSVSTQVTHEIYWGTPGVPCDIAVMKHASLYHIPPNDYSGVGYNKNRLKPHQLREDLLRGCYNARQRFYAHRGLPLYGIEYYGAATVNLHGSLTPKIQDRQVCSWLMGAPLVYSGNLSTLTDENIERYRQRFTILKRLQAAYNIYRNFQFSGVPTPTDTDWHWWGKLNDQGCGAVVVLRGNAGDDQRAINIPWVKPDVTYQAMALFSDKQLGRFTGKQLQNGDLKLKLPKLGQEILELKKVSQ